MHVRIIPKPFDKEIGMGGCCPNNGKKCCSCCSCCNEGSCCSCCSSCNTKNNKSCHGEDNHEEFACGLLEAADCAWMEVLKDKIKEHILSTQNEKMTELAKLIAEENCQRWKHKMEKKHACADFKEKLCRFFGQCKK